MVHPCHLVLILAFGEIANALSISQGHASLELDRDTLEIDGSDALRDLYADDPQALVFHAYQKEFGRDFQHGTDEYWHRRGLFELRKAKVDAHNAKPNRLWEAKAGRFADRTEAERSKMLGYRRELSSEGPSSGGTGLPPAAAAVREFLRPIQGNATLPTEHNWMHLRKANDVLDQGSCGSCWAVTSKAVLDAHYEIYVAQNSGPLRNFSAQQIVTCVPNERDCGGTGGCGGSTVELAFDWVLHNGLADETQVSYTATDLNQTLARCAESRALSMPSNSSGALVRDSPDGNVAPAMGGHAFHMHGWQKLTPNKELPLLQALYQHGPVATSVGADQFFEYLGGVLDDCQKNVTVNHAVTLFGYGETSAASSPSPASSSSSSSSGSGVTTVLEWPSPSIGSSGDIFLKKQTVKYWLIRNSWGRAWGENGFIRLKRVGDGPETCGTDHDNYQGTGCTKASADGKIPADPKTVEVCGECGFLFDSVIPLFSNSTSNATLLQQKSNVHADVSGKRDVSPLTRRENF